MTLSVKSQAYVLRTVDYSDRDIIVTLFLPDQGKVSAIARNARSSKRRFAGGIEPFGLLNVQFKQRPGRDLVMLEETVIVKGHIEIRDDFDKITIASFATELVGAFVREGQAQPRLFDLLDTYFDALCSCDPDALHASLLRFELDVLKVTGFAPDLRRCAQCAGDEFSKYRMSRHGLGLLCDACSTSHPTGVVEKSTMNILWWLDQDDFSDPPPELVDHDALAQARRIWWSSFSRVIDYELRSHAMLDQFLEAS